MTEFITKQMVIIALIFWGCLGVRAELQTWSLTDGTLLEAELVTVYSEEVILKDATGGILRIPAERFSVESQTQVELSNPPILSIEIIKDQNSVVFPAGITERMTRPPEVRCNYGMRIKQTSRGDYNHELSAEMFVIGRERQGKKYILLDRQKAPFTLTRDRNRMFEFRSDHVVILQNFYVESDVRGEKYHGYLIIVRDARDEIIAVGTSHNWAFENFENLNERYVNNFIDETCARVFPTRPPLHIRTY